MRGYYNDPEATHIAIDPEGWLCTGDEASMDQHGWFRITGRIKDLIIRGGENISSTEIEDCLRAHPAVAEAYAYPVPDRVFGEIVGVAVRVRPGHGEAASVTSDDLIAWCRDRMARFKVPGSVRFVSEFPLTASGKVQKFKLRAEHFQAMATNV